MIVAATRPDERRTDGLGQVDSRDSAPDVTALQHSRASVGSPLAGSFATSTFGGEPQMAPENDNWLKSGMDAAWDPCEVWRERVLRPRLGNGVALPAQSKLADCLEPAPARSDPDSPAKSEHSARRERRAGIHGGARGRT